ncbi:MAG: AarF/UbiB family protein [Candidatus Algichlamydia australiensis]|nr:AarF/UbiB family protein [Chlamydiales bacterium]
MFKNVTIILTLFASLLCGAPTHLDLTSVGFNSEVFFQTGANGQCIAVTKKYDATKTLLKEKKALEYLAHTSYENFSAPQILNISTERNLLTMTPAHGRQLSELIHNSDFELLKRAVRKTALSFSELHSKTNTYKKKVPNSYLKQQERIEEGVKLLTSRRVRKKFDRLKAAMEKETLAPAVIHGDPHPGNLFYDDQNDQLIMIDLVSMAPSLQRDRGGPLARDAIYARNYIKLEAEYCGLTKAQIAELMEIFDTNYTVEIPTSTREFYDFFFYADMVHSFHTFESDEKALNEQAQFFYKTSLKSL